MVSDLQRIVNVFSRVNEIWAGMIETGLATWLLYRQLGPACFVMLGIAGVASVVSSQVVKRMGASQQKWLTATQRRLKRTKQMLGSLKAIKMASQDSTAYEALRKLRTLEVKDSSGFRWIVTWSCVLSYSTLILAPPLVLGVYVGTATGEADFSVSKVFTSLIIIALLSSPLMHLFQVLPGLGAAYGCFLRIHDFLLLEEKVDYRESVVSETSAPKDPIISLRDVSLGWNNGDAPLLTDINLDVKRGTKIAIIGPVGTGKTLLLKGIIGEAYKPRGMMALAPSTNMAYCSQAPWLENVSAQRNLMQYGAGSNDMEFYRQLAADCMLDDIERLSTFASASIGSGGVMLSGGQRQRLALARALSTRSDILVLDDVFSALDRRTRWHVATSLMKRAPANSERTIIFTTHDERIASLADEVYRIDEMGHMSRTLELASEIGHALDSSGTDSPDSLEPAEAPKTDNRESQTSVKTQATLDAAEAQAAREMLGDTTVYRTYFNSVGLLHSTIFFIGAISWAVSFKFADVWVRWWSEASTRGDTRLGYWLGIYVGLGALALLVLGLWLYHQEFHVIARSGKQLHSHLASTVLKAQFPVISQIDTGISLNRFSQDLMFVDLQLPQDLFNTSFEFFTALIQIVLIATASLPALCAIPVLLARLFVLQHFYLRTSKQLRLHELETKAGLLTKIAEAGSRDGLSTIRAHGWSEINMARFLDRLDRSQEPLYLPYAVQRWLQLVLNLIVAGLVVVVLGASIALKASNKVSLGAVGVATLNAVTLGETMTQFIVAWTGLETSIGAIARIALFQRQTPAEEDVDSPQALPSSHGPGSGAVRFENLWATYNTDVDSASDTKEAQWSLQGVNLSINPGERVAVCGKTGSGKSTLHLALLRMVNMPVGSVFVDGVDHSTVPLKALRERFYVISQDWLEGFDDLRQELDPHGAFSDERLEAVLRECGVWEIVAGAPGGLAASREDCKFSAGEEQLLSVARVVLDVERRAERAGGAGGIVLLDEATSSVDRETEEKMEMLIRTRLGSMTLIAINHRLEAVLDYDRFVVLDGGRVADVGTPAELVQRCDLFAGLKARGAV